jgi:hypothetical protein
MSNAILENTAKTISARIAELQPYVEEHTELNEALSALIDAGVSVNGQNGHSAQATPKPRQSTPKPIRAPRGESSGRRGRPAGGGQTQAKIVELLTARPGLGVKEVAEALGIKPNYLYRALPNLVNAGVLRNEDKSYFVADAVA